MSGNAESLDITQLSPQQLSQLSSQLEQELEFLQNSLGKLKAAQGKFVESKEAVTKISKSQTGEDILVPLTSSMYVAGRLSDTENVIVEVGTGYYAEKKTSEASGFFDRKSVYVQKQMERLQQVLQEKFNMKRVVSEVLQMKIQATIQAQQQQGVKSS